MTTAPSHHPSRREILADLFDRLKRVQAAGGTVHSLTDTQDATTLTLCDALQALERDLRTFTDRLGGPARMERTRARRSVAGNTPQAEGAHREHHHHRGRTVGAIA